ncbi:MAG TPA: T9SS type A sorting domain-containing protein [Bacteroidia bacterium]|nr:T9SS type A sorting domain-containing protein [Bacteroidia bacterium]HMY64202.1 T9SS type A sorting domain-containing protein [Bacteroidia bacterium]HQQ49957.1 T9SS type A sorting domain-containing protein [Spirochaetota bacterium]HRF14696.1 T9SS type A sorting domain-containing protein [Bacteroidia bacterium]HRH83320.1 T9SS type A sorting domain-containing protein [Bacteroidia bacterium]
MKKNIIISLILILKVGYSTSQTVYQIPGASQQPRWVFPVYIEDAIGQKDTLYYGFSPGAFVGPVLADTIFGEYPVPYDFVNLNASASPVTSFIMYKVEIIDTSLSYYSFQLTVANTYPPTKFKWDVSTFRSDSLPFPNQSPLPNAEMHIDWYYSHNITPCPGQGFAILVTDTASGTFCFMKDSMVMDNVFPGPVDIMLGLQFRPWTGLQPVGVQQVEKNKLKIYPNPVTDNLRISIKNHVDNIQLSDLTGTVFKEYRQINSDDFIISMKDIPNGMYIIQITDNSKNQYHEKIIKTN